MTSVSKIVYIDKLDDTVNKYNSTYHSTTKMKPIDVNLEINNKNLKFKIGDIARIWNYDNIFAKGNI